MNGWAAPIAPADPVVGAVRVRVSPVAAVAIVALAWWVFKPKKARR